MTPTAAASAASNPFVGLRPFDIPDSALFFGRDDQTHELLRRLRLLHFLAVVGPSGCGKSSLIRAGVMAALADGYLADDAPWRLVTLQPGNGPLAAWIQALRPLARGGVADAELVSDPLHAIDTDAGPIAILIDQFEELFQFVERTGRSADARTFVESMIKTAAPDVRIFTILTMRSEYLAQCAEYPLLAEAINAGLHLVPRMTAAQIHEAIVAPVHKAGAAITVALTERLKDEARREADGLPVLQHALMRMWANRPPFEPLGEDGPQGTRRLGEFLNDHAEQVYGALSAAEQTATEKLFRAITELTDEGRAVRQPMELGAICASTGVDAKTMTAVVRKFEAEGFIVVKQPPGSGSPLIDISHEAIARQWRRLGSNDSMHEGWIVREARQRRAIQQVERAAKEWTGSGGVKDFLFKGLQLELASRHIGDRESQLTQTGRDFLAASRQRDERLRWLTPKVLGPAVLALAIILGLGIYSEIQRRDRIQSELTAAQAQTQSELDDARAAAAETQLRLEQLRQAATTTTTPTPDKPGAQPQPPPPPPGTASGDPSPAPGGRELPARVYLQIRSEDQRAFATGLSATLRQSGVIVPGIELVSVGPSVTELRYLIKEEETDAKDVYNTLTKAGLKLTLRFVNLKNPGRIRPRHFELWLAPNDAPEKAPIYRR